MKALPGSFFKMRVTTVFFLLLHFLLCLQCSKKVSFGRSSPPNHSNNKADKRVWGAPRALQKEDGPDLYNVAGLADLVLVVGHEARRPSHGHVLAVLHRTNPVGDLVAWAQHVTANSHERQRLSCPTRTGEALHQRREERPRTSIMDVLAVLVETHLPMKNGPGRLKVCFKACREI
jgi:hypothetical protein